MFHRSCREVKLPHSPRPYNHTLDGLEHLKLSVHFSTCPYDSISINRIFGKGIQRNFRETYCRPFAIYGWAVTYSLSSLS